MKNEYSLQQIWNRGCRDAPLTVDDSKRFAAMARSRFHTFQMGVNHAEADPNGDSLGLISGLATELYESPGLKKLWQRMAISDSEIGQQVSLQLEKLEQGTVH